MSFDALLGSTFEHTWLLKWCLSFFSDRVEVDKIWRPWYALVVQLRKRGRGADLGHLRLLRLASEGEHDLSVRLPQPGAEEAVNVRGQIGACPPAYLERRTTFKVFDKFEGKV